MAWHDVKALVYKTAEVYDGKLESDDGYSVDVRFGSLLMASAYINNYAFQDVARIASDENGVSQTAFNKEIVIQFLYKDEAGPTRVEA